MMTTAVLSSKGQITIPLAVGRKLGITTGDRVEFKVIGLDTNILVRCVTQDDAAQSALANLLIEETLAAEQPGFRFAQRRATAGLRSGHAAPCPPCPR